MSENFKIVCESCGRESSKAVPYSSSYYCPVCGRLKKISRITRKKGKQLSKGEIDNLRSMARYVSLKILKRNKNERM